jgi:hypothetical protein
MAYTRKDFGLELKEKIKKREAQDTIGKWAYKMYWKHMLEIDDDFQDFLTDLNTMEDDPQFELSYEKLDQIADRLIVGEIDIDLYNTYNGQPKEKVLERHIRQNFGKKLKERVTAKEHVTIIGSWARFHYEHMGNLDSNFKNLLENLSSMSVGFKNRRSYEELDQIADRLIAGEDVKF